MTQNKYITKSIIIIASLFVYNTGEGQTSNCNNLTAGEITPSSNCVFQPMNSDNDNDYWNSASGCNATDVDDVWMWFTATSNSAAITYETTSGGDPIITVFEGACSQTMGLHDCVNLNGAGVSETLVINTVIGNIYHIRIQNRNSNATMNGNICVQAVNAEPVTASDCPVAQQICTNLMFTIDPNGQGSINELNTSGTTLCNPQTNPASSNQGCLLSDENNPTWLRVVIASDGNLEFSFGGYGAQAGFYDWALWKYEPTTCSNVLSSNCTQPPLRCNWNAVQFAGTGCWDSPLPGNGNAGNYEPSLPVLAGEEYIICFSNYSAVSSAVPLVFNNEPGNALVECPIPLGNYIEYFDVQTIDKNGLITWGIKSNLDYRNLSLFKSIDGLNWSVIDENYQETMPSTNVFNYVDEELIYGFNYYKIIVEDQNGNIEESPVKSLLVTEKKLQVSPNPAKDFILLTSDNISINDISILDVFGNNLSINVLQYEKDKIKIDITLFLKGVYFIQYKNPNGNRQIIKLMVV